MPRHTWQLSWTGPALPLPDIAHHLRRLDELCRAARRIAADDGADPTDPDEAALLVRLAVAQLPRGETDPVGAAASADPAFIEFEPSPGPGAGMRGPAIGCASHPELLIAAAEFLGGTAGPAGIEFDTARVTLALARWRR